ncbi:hypothetical protein BSKO_03375 [Bryopsis sp. KO-2023]|nr:hypothetical protein BSKO_03375 [Bryopsis sp. KO-2023]
MEYVEVPDGKIAYTKRGTEGPVVILIHGWSGSHRYFDLNIEALSEKCQVYALDLRFHGDSIKKGPHQLAQLCGDLRDFISKLNLSDVTLVGTSMGASVIWAYIDTFKGDKISKAIFVDQAPLQNKTEDWSLGSKGCYDMETLTNLQTALRTDLGAAADDTLAACLTLPLSGELCAILKAETLKCNPDDLGELMANHTQNDWRHVMASINVPCLNVIGGTSQIFPLEGCKFVGDSIKDCANVVFEAANHWLYLEMPDEFNSLVLDFVARGNDGRPKNSVV